MRLSGLPGFPVAKIRINTRRIQLRVSQGFVPATKESLWIYTLFPIASPVWGTEAGGTLSP